VWLTKLSISDSLKALRYGARPPHEIRRVQQGGLVGVLYTKVYKESQNPQDRPMSLTGPDVELKSEGPITRNGTGVDAEYRTQPDSIPSPHFHPGATFEYAVGKSVSLSAEVTSITIRKGNPIKTLICGQYVMKYHIPCGSKGIRDPGKDKDCWTRSHSREKRLLHSICPSVRLCLSACINADST